VLFAGKPERGLAVEPLLLEELFYVTADMDTAPSALPMSLRIRCWWRPGSGIQRVAQQAFKQRG